jgi:GAF domain-containing protein
MEKPYEFLETSTHLLPLLQEIAAAIVVTDDSNTVSRLLLELAIRHVGAEKGSLMLLNGHQELYIHCAQGLDYELARSYRVKMGEGIAGLVAQSAEPMMVEDIATDERFRQVGRDRYATRSFISCPIWGKDQVIGVLNINDRKDGRPFAAADFALVQIIAAQAAVALKNAVLVNRLRAKAADLEDANRKLIDGDVGKSEFLTRISHELRTPLNSIKGAVYHLQQASDLNPWDRKDFLEIIGNETDKLIAIAEKQLDFLRVENESRIIKKTVIHLGDTLKEILNSRLLHTALGKKNLKVKLDLPTEPLDVVGDKVLTSQLLINLMEGLIHFLPEGCSGTVSVRKGEFVELSLEFSSPLPGEVVNGNYTFRNFDFSSKPDDSVKLHLARRTAEALGWQLSKENLAGGCRVSLLIPQSSRYRIEAAINTTMELVLDFTSELFGVSNCSLMLADELTGDLVINCARGLDEAIVRQTRINAPSRIAGWVAQEGKPLLVEDIGADPRFFRMNLDTQYNSRSLLSLPLKVQDRVVGVLNLNNKKSGDAFSQQDLQTGMVFMARIAAFVEKLYTGSWTDDELGQLLTSLDALLNAERKYPKKDPRQLRLMNRLMEELDAAAEGREIALYISMIYDLGLMLIDRGVMEKSDPLSLLEKSALKSHPYTTLDLLGAFEPSEMVRRIILHHHERFDGRGYPDGLKGEDIPFLSRALAVVDAYCAMTEVRPYRQALGPEEVMNEIRKGAGTHYDPRMVEALERISLDQGYGNSL